jgi:hypothetical protein
MIPPKFSDFDVGIHGGTLAGVSAALELKRRGYSVWLSTHRSYLGEDVCDPLRLMLPADLDTADPLLRRLFPEESAKSGFIRPMSLKRELDRLLMEAEIPVFQDSAPGEIFVTDAGAVRGLSLTMEPGQTVALVGAASHGAVFRRRSPRERESRRTARNPHRAGLLAAEASRTGAVGSHRSGDAGRVRPQRRRAPVAGGQGRGAAARVLLDVNLRPGWTAADGAAIADWTAIFDAAGVVGAAGAPKQAIADGTGIAGTWRGDYCTADEHDPFCSDRRGQEEGWRAAAAALGAASVRLMS